MSAWKTMNDTDAHEQQISLKDMVLFKALLPYLKPQWRLILVSFLLLPLVSLSQVLQPIVIKRALDGPVANGDVSGLVSMSLLFLGLVVMHYGVRYFQLLTTQMTGQNLVLSIRKALYDHLQGLPMDYFHHTPIGKVVTRISADTENVSEMFASGGVAIFADMVTIIGVFIGMFFVDVRLALTVAVMLPVIVVTMEFFRRQSRKIYNQLRVQLAQVNTTLQESISGIDVIHLLQRESHQQAQFAQVNGGYLNTNLRSVAYDSTFTASIEVLTYVAIVLVIAYVMMVNQGGLGAEAFSIGVIVAFLRYVQLLFSPIEDLSNKFTIVQSGLASMEKIMEFMLVAQRIEEPAQPYPLQRAEGRICFDQVTFGYDPDQPILNNFSLVIEPGEKVAIIGPSGAGKTTLIKLLSRQYDPQQGVITLDGQDIRQYALADVRRNIVTIPQDEFLFSRTIHENITMTYPPQMDREALMQVATRVHANRVIERQPQGLETLLPERGRNLSNGERQLLIFARALWHNPAIIVLDEATSSIDPQTEALVQDALETLLEGQTSIVIAHRLSTITYVDKVIVLENGTIVDSGPPAELLKKKHLFAGVEQAY